MCDHSRTKRLQTHTHDASGLRADDNIFVSNLEEGNQYKFLGVLETVGSLRIDNFFQDDDFQ